MKRRTPLARRTPLKAGRWSRTPGTGTRSPGRRARGRKRQRMDPALRRGVFIRARHRCDRCGTWTTVDDGHAHHRKLRSRGGVDDHANLVALCAACHDHVHRHPAQATTDGLMVPSWADPATIPVRRYDGHAYLPRPYYWGRYTEGANE